MPCTPSIARYWTNRPPASPLLPSVSLIVIVKIARHKPVVFVLDIMDIQYTATIPFAISVTSSLNILGYAWYSDMLGAGCHPMPILRSIKPFTILALDL